MPRPRYVDLEPGDFSPPAMVPWAAVELKFDGLFARFVGGPEGWSITGRNGAMLRYGYEPCPECYLQGEFIDGTEWAAGSVLYGCFVAWDCIYWRNQCPGDYVETRHALAQAARDATPKCCRVIGVPSWSIAAAATHWVDCGRKGDEGLIFRSADGQRFGRMKRVVTMDYFVTGCRKNGPRVTALYGGLYIAGRWETACTVPVKSPREQAALFEQDKAGKLLSRVFEAKGNAVLKSGALRHPRQAGKDGAVKWRADKAAGECVL